MLCGGGRWHGAGPATALAAKLQVCRRSQGGVAHSVLRGRALQAASHRGHGGRSAQTPPWSHKGQVGGKFDREIVHFVFDQTMVYSWCAWAFLSFSEGCH